MSFRSTVKKIPFHSEEGQKILGESLYQPLLIKLFKKQQNNTFCGIHSCALVMSAQHLGKGKESGGMEVTDPPFTEANMFQFKETQEAISFEAADKDGLTLDQLNNLFLAHGKKTQCRFASHSSVEEFRSMAAEAMSNGNSSCGLVVNFDEFELGQDEVVRGHFSPIAAFHKGKDMVLLLDTWFETTDVWVGVKDLFHTMNTIDPDTKKSRGWIVFL